MESNFSGTLLAASARAVLGDGDSHTYGGRVLATGDMGDVFRYNDGELILASQQKALLKAQQFFAKKSDNIKNHTDDFLKNRKKIWGE